LPPDLGDDALHFVARRDIWLGERGTFVESHRLARSRTVMVNPVAFGNAVFHRLNLLLCSIQRAIHQASRACLRPRSSRGVPAFASAPVAAREDPDDFGARPRR